MWESFMKKIIIPVWSALSGVRKEKKEILSAVNRVFRSGIFILGKECEAFEDKFAQFCTTRYGIGVGNGTDAIFLALKALDIGTGDEIITVPNTAIPTVSAIVTSGARPVFTDVLSDTLLMDPTKIAAALTKRTKAIIPVHLYGQCCRMDEIMALAKAHRIPVIEDCAQSHGAEWKGKKSGSFGMLAAFSFYPTKVLGAYGDAGMVLTQKKDLEQKLRMLRMYGMKGTYDAYIHGYNSRLDEVHAAILSKKLTHIKTYIAKRRNIASWYNTHLSSLPLTLPSQDPRAGHVFHLYVVRYKKRDDIILFLKKMGIAAAIHYPQPIHLMRAYKFLGYSKGDFPIAELACREVFSLPMYPQLQKKDQERITSALKAFFS